MNGFELGHRCRPGIKQNPGTTLSPLRPLNPRQLGKVARALGISRP
jgi:hypothetical protein